MIHLSFKMKACQKEIYLFALRLGQSKIDQSICLSKKCLGGACSTLRTSVVAVADRTAHLDQAVNGKIKVNQLVRGCKKIRKLALTDF